MSEFKSLHGYFGACGWNVEHEFALDILPHMRKDVLAGLQVIRWDDNYRPVVRSTFKSLSGLNDWAGDNFNYCFDILWNGQS